MNILCPNCGVLNSMSDTKYTCTRCSKVRNPLTGIVPYVYTVSLISDMQGRICRRCNRDVKTVYQMYYTSAGLYIVRDIFWCTNCCRSGMSRFELEYGLFEHVEHLLKKRDAALDTHSIKKAIMSMKDLPQIILLDWIRKDYLLKEYIYDRILGYNKKERLI